MHILTETKTQPNSENEFMAQSHINLVHILKPAPKTLFGSGLRMSFFRAWMYTAIKVLVIATFLNGNNVYSKIEENITLLDQFVRDDFTAVRSEAQLKYQRKISTNTAIAPRGPALAAGEIAGAIDNESTIRE